MPSRSREREIPPSWHRYLGRRVALLLDFGSPNDGFYRAGEEFVVREVNVGGLRIQHRDGTQLHSVRPETLRFCQLDTACR